MSYSDAHSAGSAFIAKVAYLLALVMLAVAVHAVSSASAAYEEVGSFAGGGSGPGGSGSEDGQLLNPEQIAVDGAGRLFVADTGNSRVQIFEPTERGAEYGAQFATQEASGVAIDPSNGDLYLAHSGGSVGKYDSELFPVLGWTAPAVVGALAVDPSTGDLLVADREANLVRRFESDGTPDGSFAVERPISVAANSAGEIFVVTSTGDVTLECGASSTVRRFSGAGIETGVVGGWLTAPGAVAVDPDDDSIVVASRVNQYNCGTENPLLTFFDGSGTETESLALSGDTLFATVPGLIAQGRGSTRVFVLTKSPAGDSLGATRATVFSELREVPPAIVSQSVSSLSTNTAHLRAQINPNGFATTYRFELGREDCVAGTCTPVSGVEAGLGSAQWPRSATARLTQLAPGTTYHYRVVATNQFGTSVGPDRTFATFAAVEQEPACPNSQLRVGAAAHLPNCRAYEQVSPIAKNYADVANGDVASSSPLTFVSDDGNSVAYGVAGAFPGAAANSRLGVFLSVRSPAGWLTHGLNPPRHPPEYLGTLDVVAVSRDLTKALVRTNAALTPDATAGSEALYIRDTRTGSFEFIAGSSEPNPFPEYLFYGASPDFGVVFFTSAAKLTPNAESGVENLYEWRAGQLRLANTLVNGVAIPSGVAGGVSFFTGPFANGQSPVSSDGSRVFFQRATGSAGVVFVRDDGAAPAPVSISHRSGAAGEIGVAILSGISRDGSRAFVTAREPLADGASQDALYRYDIETGEQVVLAKEGVVVVQGISKDGSIVYFLSTAALAPGANPDEYNLYVSDEGITRFITAISPGDTSSFGSPQGGKVSDDGNYLTVLSRWALTGQGPQGVREVYVYDLAADRLMCASCPQRGADPIGDASLLQEKPGGQPSYLSQNTVLDNGRVFFETADPLVARDTNGVIDVYMWQEADVSLISSGRGGTPSYFGGATVSGDDVFFSTRDQLVAQDRDEFVDLYNARVNGGIAAQGGATAPAPCSGDGCRGPLTVPAPASPIGSAAFSGPNTRKAGRKKAKRKKAGRQHRKKRGKQKQKSSTGRNR